MTVKPSFSPSGPSEIATASAANVVKSIRESFGYSIEDLAVTCGLAVSEIARIENGEEADPALLRRIASALNLPEGAIAEERPEK